MTLPTFNPACNACSLHQPNSSAVGWANPDSPRLIIVSDYPGAYEVREGYPFYDNWPERTPRRTRTGRTIEGWPNAGANLMRALSEVLELRRQDCYLTNAIKCNPAQHTVSTQHLTTCTSLWLYKELEALDVANPTTPLLCAGAKAFLACKKLDPSLNNKSLQSVRRTTTHRWGEHPLIFTFNPAGATRPRLEEEVIEHVTSHRQRIISIRQFPEIPGTPWWNFCKDLECLRQFL